MGVCKANGDRRNSPKPDLPAEKHLLERLLLTPSLPAPGEKPAKGAVNPPQGVAGAKGHLPGAQTPHWP